VQPRPERRKGTSVRLPSFDAVVVGLVEPHSKAPLAGLLSDMMVDTIVDCDLALRDRPGRLSRSETRRNACPISCYSPIAFCPAEGTRRVSQSSTLPIHDQAQGGFALVLAFGAAPVETAVPAGPNPAGTCDRSQGNRHQKHRSISFRLRGRIGAGLDLYCLDRLANWLKRSRATRSRACYRLGKKLSAPWKS
jgi:hypothetical protein